MIAYWVGPWLGVFFSGQFLRRGIRVDGLLYAKWCQNWAGPVAMVVGLVAQQVPAVGDITFAVGFVLSALLYAALRPWLGANRTTPPTE